MINDWFSLYHNLMLICKCSGTFCVGILRVECNVQNATKNFMDDI